MTSLLEQHEQIPGCGAGAKTAAEAVAAHRGRGHASVRPSAILASGADDAVGAWLAGATHAQSVSRMSLRAVARELKAHDAPPELVRTARSASAAALNNAAMLETLALRWGVRPRQPAVVSIAVRPLEALAAENASQGCVRETWAALEARYQSLAARDPVIRRTMDRVACDALRHAELSWVVDAWARRRLERAARDRVGHTRLQAVQDLLGALSIERERELCIEAGLPNVATARGLAQALREALWSRSLAN